MIPDYLSDAHYLELETFSNYIDSFLRQFSLARFESALLAQTCGITCAIIVSKSVSPAAAKPNRPRCLPSLLSEGSRKGIWVELHILTASSEDSSHYRSEGVMMQIHTFAKSIMSPTLSSLRKTSTINFEASRLVILARTQVTPMIPFWPFMQPLGFGKPPTRATVVVVSATLVSYGSCVDWSPDHIFCVELDSDDERQAFPACAECGVLIEIQGLILANRRLLDDGTQVSTDEDFRIVQRSLSGYLRAYELRRDAHVRDLIKAKSGLLREELQYAQSGISPSRLKDEEVEENSS
ncbi:uncharacterized protein CLUP02_14280 [Colletotrichum lupini]|uniref:Uncharacterized protein n=1 Tax=Colletotrichum lupini TaxID=145971 RepID=A0A9Q8T4A1_9PEZI|nr:uncharacterized protein CLUP02_14280 [Colletotrichum lupini]UQC88755.1 hypothetical protein CLUP02_14280 [Colletotrichum lupini]